MFLGIRWLQSISRNFIIGKLRFQEQFLLLRLLVLCSTVFISSTMVEEDAAQQALFDCKAPAYILLSILVSLFGQAPCKLTGFTSSQYLAWKLEMFSSNFLYKHPARMHHQSFTNAPDSTIWISVIPSNPQLHPVTEYIKLNYGQQILGNPGREYEH